MPLRYRRSDTFNREYEPGFVHVVDFRRDKQNLAFDLGVFIAEVFRDPLNSDEDRSGPLPDPIRNKYTQIRPSTHKVSPYPLGGRMKPSEQIDQRIAGIADWRGKVLARIRRIMLEADPAVTEDWKWMGTPVWYCDGMVSLANPHKGKVKWTFVKGAHFADADHVFNAGLEGNEWRAIDIFEKDRLDEAALRRLVKTAIAYNRSQLKGTGGPEPAKKAPRASRRPKKRS